MANACLRRADPHAAAHWLERCRPSALTRQQQACMASAEMSLHCLTQDLPAAQALLRWADCQLPAFPAVLAQMRVLMAEAYVKQGQLQEAQSLIDSVHLQADTLTTDEHALFWRVQAQVSLALGRSAQALEARNHEAACIEARQKLLNDYQVKSAQLTLHHLEARLLLAHTAQEVQQLKRAVYHHEVLLARMAPPHNRPLPWWPSCWWTGTCQTCAAPPDCLTYSVSASASCFSPSSVCGSTAGWPARFFFGCTIPSGAISRRPR
ncbi:hypothetical protein [Ideonella paludis]|uniref:hypothetical protein n=1 Tax=Ideonella paludis TaxID=1233411 RepID=UPI0036301F4F